MLDFVDEMVAAGINTSGDVPIQIQVIILSFVITSCLISFIIVIDIISVYGSMQFLRGGQLPEPGHVYSQMCATTANGAACYFGRAVHEGLCPVFQAYD